MRYLSLSVHEYKLLYKISLRNKISFLVGDSATGKSRLVEFISRYNRNKEIGIGLNEDIVINSDFKNIFTVESKNDLITYSNIRGSLLIVDELYMNIILQNLNIIKKSENFFLLIFRDMISNITTGIYDILELCSNKDNGYTVNYSKPIYSFTECTINPEFALVEDSGSGYKFYAGVLSVKCLSSRGKTRVIKEIYRLLDKTDKDLLIIVDEVDFGYEFNKLMSYEDWDLSRVYLWCPLSFEYVLLNSGMFKTRTEDVFNTCDWGKYSTVEKFIEHLLRENMKKCGYSYSKGMDVTEIFKSYINTIFYNNFDNYQNLIK